MKVLDPIGGFRILGGTYLLNMAFGVALIFLDTDVDADEINCSEFHTLRIDLIIAHWVIAITNIGSIFMKINELMMVSNIVRLFGVFFYQYIIFSAFVVYLNSPASC
jgi:hypothetical protein